MFETVEEGGLSAMRFQLLARHWFARDARTRDHLLHIDQDFVGVLGFGEALHVLPEYVVIDPEVGDEAALLQIAARQRAVEIIDERGADGFVPRAARGSALGPGMGVGHAYRTRDRVGPLVK